MKRCPNGYTKIPNTNNCRKKNITKNENKKQLHHQLKYTMIHILIYIQHMMTQISTKKITER